MPGILLKTGVRRTAVVSLSAAGATSLTYLYSNADTKEAWQVAAVQQATKSCRSTNELHACQRVLWYMLQEEPLS